MTQRDHAPAQDPHGALPFAALFKLEADSQAQQAHQLLDFGPGFRMIDQPLELIEQRQCLFDGLLAVRGRLAATSGVKHSPA